MSRWTITPRPNVAKTIAGSERLADRCDRGGAAPLVSRLARDERTLDGEIQEANCAICDGERRSVPTRTRSRRSRVCAIPISIGDSWLKYERAVEHFNALALDTEAYLESGPQWSVAVRVPEADVLEPEFEVDPPPPARLGTIVGDMAHNPRSALDVAAWQLALDHNEANATSNQQKVYFPLYSDAEEFRVTKSLQFFSEEAQAIIERHQPFQAGSAALLWLHDISNADKHRVTTFSLAGMRAISGEESGVTAFSPHLRFGSADGHLGLVGIRAIIASVGAVLQDLDDRFGSGPPDIVAILDDLLDKP